MKIIRLIAILVAALLAAPVTAQQGELERIRPKRKRGSPSTWSSQPAEAEGFWPVYEGYQKESIRSTCA